MAPKIFIDGEAGTTGLQIRERLEGRSDLQLLSIDPERDPNAQGRKAGFVASLDRGGDVNRHSVQPAPSRHLLSAGHVIPASLITGLRSDLPGLVIAQVTERVYDGCLQVDGDADPTAAPHTALLPVDIVFGNPGDLTYRDRLATPAGRPHCNPQPATRQRRAVS